MLKSSPVSARQGITESQARLFARLLRRAERALLNTWAVSSVGALPADDEGRVEDVDDYVLLREAAEACGLVCRDLPASADLPRVTRSDVASWDIKKIRRYLHTLFRAERWNEGGGPLPVYDAFRRDILSGVASRMERLT